jgi:hypothetical protein
MSAQPFESREAFKDQQINRNDLESELAINPSNIGYYGNQAALWNAEAERQKFLRDVRGSQILLRLKEELGSKATDKFVEAHQKTDAEYQQAYADYYYAKQQNEAYEKALIALRAKQSSLGSLNAIQRAEYQATNPTSSVESAEEKAARRERIVAAQG